MTTTTKQTSVVTRADWVPGPPQGCWTYDDYAAIPDDGHRYEIVDGVLYMSPAPNIVHQRTVKRIAITLTPIVEDAGFGEVFVAPVDTELAPRVVFQPDIIVVLKDRSRVVTATRIVGAPDLVIEVLSPGTRTYDLRTKLDAYARAGIPEYWLADPYSRSIEVLALTDGAYRSVGIFEGDAALTSLVLPDLTATAAEFFPHA
ncbi:MAG: Uma2 family endonuclease [Dehalococcoidia bacterium]